MNAWLPVLAYAVLIFSLSSLPDLTPPGGVTHSDKVAHLVEYAVLGALLARAMTGIRGRRRWVVATLVASALAGGDELFQLTVGRAGTWGDWITDTIGAAVAAIAVTRFATTGTGGARKDIGGTNGTDRGGTPAVGSSSS